MIAIPTTLWVFQGTQAQDFWESIDGFAGVVPAHLDRDPMTGNVEPVWRPLPAVVRSWMYGGRREPVAATAAPS